MELATTFRGLNEMECGTATRALERNSARLDRLLDKPTTLKVVVDGGQPEYRVMLAMGMHMLGSQKVNGSITVMAGTFAISNLKISFSKITSFRP